MMAWKYLKSSRNTQEVLNMPPMRAELTRNAAHLFWGAGQPTRLAENLRPRASSTLTVLYVGFIEKG
uniref:Uncharacterized protein n=1 Tax=Timema douglasi TaxID=61478 RepID=A0A7R8ZCI2_TIMDO|nr:unnamed protein product [Timema douglasi]